MSWHYLDTASQSAFGSPLAQNSNQNQIDNAAEIWAYFRNLGYSEQATAALIGNAQHESYLNPAQWQVSVGATTGAYGLWQWDPTTRYTQTYCGTYGYDRTNGYYQCQWVDTQTIGGLEGNQWIAKPGVTPATWEGFKVSTDSPADLAYTFCRNWERGEWVERRATNSQYWYQYFTGTQPDPPTPDPGDSSYAAWFGVFKMLQIRRRAEILRRYKYKSGGGFR